MKTLAVSPPGSFCRLLPVCAALVMCATVAPATAQENHATIPGALEGRPDSRSVSPLQVRIDAARRLAA